MEAYRCTWRAKRQRGGRLSVCSATPLFVGAASPGDGELRLQKEGYCCHHTWETTLGSGNFFLTTCRERSLLCDSFDGLKPLCQLPLNLFGPFERPGQKVEGVIVLGETPERRADLLLPFLGLCKRTLCCLFRLFGCSDSLLPIGRSAWSSLVDVFLVASLLFEEGFALFVGLLQRFLGLPDLPGQGQGSGLSKVHVGRGRGRGNGRPPVPVRREQSGHGPGRRHIEGQRRSS